MSIKESENLYIRAKQTYYEGNPILSDFEFDILEEKLKAANSQVTKIVGSQNLKDAKFNHVSPMLSLNKIQVQRNEPIPIDLFLNWYTTNKTANSKYLESSPKFDGSSCNLIYENGILQFALTRGDKEKGQNIIEKMKHIVPLTINSKQKIEIRGEVVIPVKTFNEKYSKIYKNPRNFVAGILGRDDIDNTIISDFHFVTFEARIHENNTFYHHSETQTFLRHNGFITSPFLYLFEPKDFESTYHKMLNFREKDSPYQLDGMVIKFAENLRNEIGETDYAPKWAIAIKFPPKESITTIKSIAWSVGISAEYTPVAVLEPVDLDGTTVTNVNLHNYGNVVRQGLLPGAKVIIVKSGDIIPIVQKVIEPSIEKIENHLPTPCSPECKMEIQGSIHLVCTNPNCPTKSILKLGRGISVFSFKNVAGSTIRKIHKAGITKVQDVFDNTKFNEAALIASGEFKKGRQLEILLESRNNPDNKITLPLVICALAFPNVGWSLATQIAKLFENETPDWTGLTAACYTPFLNKNSTEYKKVLEFVDILNANGFKVIKEQKVQISTDAIICEFTGSPKPFGFKTKEEFLEKIKSHGFVHGKLDKNCKYLITDDINSTSSKMSSAKKLGVEIKTYEDILNMTK